MTKSGRKAGGKRKAAKPDSKKKPAKDNGKRNRLIDIVEEAGKESFPASDPPSWNP